MKQSFRAEDTPPELIEQLRRPMNDLRDEMRARAKGNISLRQLWNATLAERIPDEIRALVEKLK